MSKTQWTESARQEWADSHIHLGQSGPFFSTKAPDAAWRQRFETSQSNLGLPASLDPLADEEFRNLVQTAKQALNGILAFGGWAVCHPALDDDLDRILARGILLDGARARKTRGRPCDCHVNSAEIWMGLKETTSVMTGYALSDDGMWRVHSWVATLDQSGKPRLLETTVPRRAYFGFLRSPEETLELLDHRSVFKSQKDRLEDMRSRLLTIQPESALAGIR